MRRYKYPTINTDTYTLNERIGVRKGRGEQTEKGRGEEKGMEEEEGGREILGRG